MRRLFGFVAALGGLVLVGSTAVPAPREAVSGQDKESRAQPAVAPALIKLEPKEHEAPFFVFSRDGNLLAYNRGVAVHVYDVKAKKDVQRLDKERTRSSPTPLVFSPNGSQLLVGHRIGQDFEFWLWDTKTGNHLCALHYDPAPIILDPDPFAFTPAGKTIVGMQWRNDAGGLQLWDAASGKGSRSIGWNPDGVGAFRLSEDGKTIVAEHWKEIGLEEKNNFYYFTFKIHVRLWEVASGRDLGPIGKALDKTFKMPRRRLTTDEFPPGTKMISDLGVQGHGCRVRISPSGRIMVFARDTSDAVLQVSKNPPEGYSLCLVDLATGTELHKLNELDEIYPYHFTLSPNSGLLAVQGQMKKGYNGIFQTMVLLDVSHWRDEALKSRKDPTAKDLATLWDDLGAEEPAKAFQALRRMTASPQTVLPFLKKQLQPAPNDSKKIASLISQLDDKNFMVRENATKELLQFGEQAESAVAKALVKPESLEARQRLEKVLGTLKKETWPDAPMRCLLWGIEFLELNGSPTAIEVLERLATGGPEAWVTQEAIISLDRLGKKPKK